MHDQRNPRGEKLRKLDVTPAEEDRFAQSAVLHLLLDVYPVQLSTEELNREMTMDPDDFGERDQIERAVRDLSQAGLLHRQNGFVVPTRAAVRCEQILGD